MRYIHLNPVRAKMVRRPEQYEFSSHRAYLGLEPSEIVDVDSVLRHFGAKKEVARTHFTQFVMAGKKLGHRNDFYQTGEHRVLGTEEFVDSTIHRIGEAPRILKSMTRTGSSFNEEALIAAVEKNCGMSRREFCGPAKNAAVVRAKEALIVVGEEVGATMTKLAEITGASTSTISRRHDAARLKLRQSLDLTALVHKIKRQYEREKHD